ncbi:hypothetical protein G3I15_40950, partial [Streptomyces sp. SID10244]|nr:hypothetical protein [Streptomyces sp. SID10244]
GNAEEFAILCADRLAGTGRAVTTVSMDDCDPGRLPDNETVLFVTSTTGDGDPPDNGSEFWDALNTDDAPDLSGVRYAVLAFG